LMEHWFTKLMIETGVGERMQRESLVHDGIYMCFNGELRHIDFNKLIGKRVTIYGQQEVVKDLIARRVADGGEIFFEVENTSVQDFAGDKPKIRFRHQGRDQVIECDLIAGCDGYHGVSRPSFPEGAHREYERVYPFGWLGILAKVKPVADELIYAYHERGF